MCFLINQRCLYFYFQYGDTSLHLAAEFGHAGVTRILISAGAKVSLQNTVSNPDNHGRGMRESLDPPRPLTNQISS